MLIYTPENHLKLVTKVEAFASDKILSREEKSQYHVFRVKAENAFALIEFLKNDAELAFDYFIDLAGIDYLNYPEKKLERFVISYTLMSTKLGIKTQVQAFVSEAELSIASVTSLFAGANWTEREVFDLYGIEFTGHPDLKRILMPDDFEGHPLRKDYPLRGRGERSSFPVYQATHKENQES